MLIGLSLDHRRADLAVREQFVLPREEQARLGRAARHACGAQVVFLNTCSRVELICWVPSHSLAEAVAGLHAVARRLSPRLAPAYFARAGLRAGAASARHLFRVAAGLESQVPGDIQVLGQVRDAYNRAVGAGSVGAELHRLFQSALRAGRRTHAETALGPARASVGGSAAHLAGSVLGGLAGKAVVVLGCGSVGRSAARALADCGARVTLLNRTESVAITLARKLGAEWRPYSQRHREIATACLTIIATGAGAPTVTAGALAEARAALGAELPPVLLLDLASPRNVEPAVGSFPWLALLDLNHIAGAGAMAADHQSAVLAAEEILEEELARLVEWAERRKHHVRIVA
ncbi:MAG: hypothetical protein SGJ01_14780 [Gemmatimonadota bacterium]|nr:hypothetical protein [Gemmatimonadota bacterium]